MNDNAEREIKTAISGNKLNGFIVEAHDGDLHTIHPVFAEHEDAAIDMALRERRGEPAPVHDDQEGESGEGETLFPFETTTPTVDSPGPVEEPIIEPSPVEDIAGSPIFSDEHDVIDETPAGPIAGAIPDHVAGDLRAMDEKPVD